MVEKIVSFNAKKAEEARDCRLWTVEDALKEVLNQLPEYEWDKCLILLHRRDGEAFFVDFRVAGCTTLEARGLMQTHLIEEIADKFND